MATAEATAEHTVPQDAANAAPPPQKVVPPEGTPAADSPADAEQQAVASKVASKAATAAPATECHSHIGHVTFLPVPDEQKLPRSMTRKRWREPLYDMPCGAHHALSCFFLLAPTCCMHLQPCTQVAVSHRMRVTRCTACIDKARGHHIARVLVQAGMCEVRVCIYHTMSTLGCRRAVRAARPPTCMLLPAALRG